MSTTVHHCCLDVRGALKNFKKRDLARMFRMPDGRRATADEARDVLFDHLEQGHKVLPLDKDCEGFSYQTGCPGHEEPDEEVKSA